MMACSGFNNFFLADGAAVTEWTVVAHRPTHVSQAIADCRHAASSERLAQDGIEKG